MMGLMGKPEKRKTSKGTRWMARVWVAEESRKRSIGTFDTRGEAQQAMNEFYARPRPGRTETCDSFATRWVRDYPRARTSTNKHNAERVKKFGKDFKGRKMSDVDRPSARAWALENRGSLAAVRAMFNDALDDEIVVRNPFANLRLPQSKGRKNIGALTEAELAELAGCAPQAFPGVAGETLKAMILFSGYTGIRQGELFALRRTDLGHDELTIRRSYSSSSREFTAPKNGQERTVVLPAPARDAIAQLPRRADRTDFVFTNPRDGHHWTKMSHGYYWRNIRTLFGRPTMAWHELRHACATILLERGLPPHIVAHQLGHTDGGILVQRLYGHPDAGRMRDEIKRAWGAGVVPLRSVAGTQTGTDG